YGLGADATRSAAVKGIYQAKQRPSDNPLIVHIASLKQLRKLLSTSNSSPEVDPVPQIYHPLIQRFWPGPITIILPVPEDSKLAPEVTAGLRTFGARMPRSLLALALIKTADVPVAAPSANASTKPSPTAAEHVRYDLDGRIELIVDGGPCDVGVESTVVDGLSSPPAVLRPGGVGIDLIKTVPGWENTVVGYHDVSLKGDAAPRAPGMKYRHYSPKAPVMLVEATGGKQPHISDLSRQLGSNGSLGLVRTKTWKSMLGDE
ncbi:translation factor, partial [Aureobasidium melanogenum]